MRLALLSGANCRTAKCGPKVRLHKGTWRFVVVGSEGDAFIFLNNETTCPMQLPNGQLLEGPQNVSAFIDKTGKEENISVFAELVNGS